MKTLSIASSKGGVGKTTIAIHIAVAAVDSGKSVLILDTDPQGSAYAWWNIRENDQPFLVQCSTDKIAEYQENACRDGIDLVIIDSAPAHTEDVLAVSKAADLTLIPSRPSFLDLDAIGSTVKAVAEAGKLSAILFNACPPGRGVGEASVTHEARQVLAGAPIPACEVSLTQRAALSHAFNGGQAVSEYEPGGKGAAEITSLFKWIDERLFNGT